MRLPFGFRVVRTKRRVGENRLQVTIVGDARLASAQTEQIAREIRRLDARRLS